MVHVSMIVLLVRGYEVRKFDWMDEAGPRSSPLTGPVGPLDPTQTTSILFVNPNPAIPVSRSPCFHFNFFITLCATIHQTDCANPGNSD